MTEVKEPERTDRECRVCGESAVVDETPVLCEACAARSRVGDRGRMRVIRIGVG